MTLNNELKKMKRVLLAAVLTQDEMELTKINSDTGASSKGETHESP